jgi:hypothetical protein
MSRPAQRTALREADRRATATLFARRGSSVPSARRSRSGPSAPGNRSGGGPAGAACARAGRAGGRAPRSSKAPPRSAPWPPRAARALRGTRGPWRSTASPARPRCRGERAWLGLAAARSCARRRASCAAARECATHAHARAGSTPQGADPPKAACAANGRPGLSDVLCVVRGDRHHGLMPRSGSRGARRAKRRATGACGPGEEPR